VNKTYNMLKAAFYETSNFYFSSRVFAFHVIFFLLMLIYAEPVKSISKMLNCKATPWILPFYSSSLYYNLIFLLGAIYMYSESPYLERWQMYPYLRIGKKRWIFTHILKTFLSSFLFVGTVIFCSIISLIPEITVDSGWGKLYYTLSLTNINGQDQFLFNVSYSLIRKYSPLKWILIIMISFSLIVSLIGMIMFFLSINCSRYMAIIISTLFAIFPILLENTNTHIQRILVQTLPTEWLRIGKLGNININGVLSPDVGDVIVRLFIMNIFMSAIIYFSSINKEFHWYMEE